MYFDENGRPVEATFNVWDIEDDFDYEVPEPDEQDDN